MIKTNVLIIGCIIVATIFGIFGQNMAYFLNEHIIEIPPIYYLTALTIMSWILYLLPIVIIVFVYKKQKIKKETFINYLSVNCLIGFLISMGSFFVLAMWWG